MNDKPGTDLMIYTPVGGEGGLSGMDDRLLRLVKDHPRISMEELSEKLGIESMTPARCGQRVREILKAQDWLSITDQKSLLLLDLVWLRDRLFERIEDGESRITKYGQVIEVESNPALFSAAVRLLKEWHGIIQSMQSDVDGDKLTIRETHAKIMMDAIMVMFKEFITRLSEEGVEIPMALAMALMEEVMPLGFQSLEKRTAA